MTASFFPVRKSDDVDRGITNRIPQNAWEVGLPCAILPNGTQWSQVILDPDEVLRLSAEDLPTYFPLLRVPDAKARRNAVGPPFSAGYLRSLGFQVEAPYADEEQLMMCFSHQVVVDHLLSGGLG